MGINPGHPIIQSINALYQKDPHALIAKTRVEIIFNTAAHPAAPSVRATDERARTADLRRGCAAA
eukprot:gene18244-13110_t